MRSATLHFLTIGMLWLGALPGCGPNDNNILVTVNKLPIRAKTLTLKATLNNEPGRYMNSLDLPTLSPPPSSFGVNIDGANTGHLKLIAQAFDSDGCLQGNGVLEADLPVGRTDLALSMEAQSPRQCGNLAPCGDGILCPGNVDSLTTTMKGLWVNSPNDVWAVGDNSTILHYQGKNWEISILPTVSTLCGGISTPQTNLKSIWGNGPSDMWTVGTNGRTFHYDGSVWSYVQNNAACTSVLNSVWGVSGTDVWAVGNKSDLSQEFWHWNGQNWSSVTTNDPDILFSVWASSPSDIYASTTQGFLIHFDGSMWSYITLPPNVDLLSVWGSSPTNVFTVGAQGAMFRFDGTTWNSIPGMVFQRLNSVFGDGNAIYTVGTYNSSNNSNFFKSTAPYDSVVPQNLGNNYNLNSVVIGSNGIGWAVGDGGVLGYFDTRP